MVFRRRFRKGRRGGAPAVTRFMKPVQKANYVARKAFIGVKRLRGLVNAERKQFDLIVSASSISSLGGISNLCLVPVGDDVGQRNGRSIYLRNIAIRGMIEMHTTPTQQNNFVRIILFRDNNDVGVAALGPAVSDYLTTTGTGNVITSPYNLANIGRFYTLYDRTFRLTDAAITAVPFKIFRKMNIHVKYSSTATDGVGKNQHYLLMVSSEVSGSNVPTVAFTSRISYYDN